jgi:hypothetical protein
LAGYVKCQYVKCGGHVPIQEKDTLIVEVKVSESGTKKNIYYHHECYPKYLKEQEFIRDELLERDELDRVVKSIYGFKLQLPAKFWWMIQDLRNGTNRFESFFKKRYKKGISYDIIREAYMLGKQDIEWAKMSKRFASLEQELRYGLRIMQSKLNDADRKIKTREQQAKINKAMEQVHIEDMRDNREVSFKRKQDDSDFSYLLGND